MKEDDFDLQRKIMRKSSKDAINELKNLGDDFGELKEIFNKISEWCKDEAKKRT